MEDENVTGKSDDIKKTRFQFHWTDVDMVWQEVYCRHGASTRPRQTTSKTSEKQLNLRHKVKI